MAGTAAQIERSSKRFVKKVEEAKEAGRDLEAARERYFAAKEGGDAEAIATARRDASEMEWRASKAWGAVANAGKRLVDLTESGSEAEQAALLLIADTMGS